MTKLQLAAMERIDTPEEKRRDFYLYTDEFQNFIATDTFPQILSEARKYRLCLIMAHQYISQLDGQTREAVFGNVGTTISFRVGATDAALLEEAFGSVFARDDFMSLDKYMVYLTMAIDGKSSRPFSAVTLPPFYDNKFQGNKDKVIKVSRRNYSGSRADIEGKIGKWMRQ